MATDTLEIFGTEYTGVTGVKATDSNNQTKTYIRPQGSVSITASGNTDVTAYATASVASGTAGTPTATKGTVSNHSINVTPSVTNSAGYISGGTHTGTAVSVSASELVSGTYTVDSSGTKDVTNYAEVSVAAADPYVCEVNNEFYTSGGRRCWRIYPKVEIDVGAGDAEGWIADGYSKIGEEFETLAVPSNTTITPTTSSQTIGGANYMMEGAVTVAAMPSGTEGTPTATKGTVSNHSISVTPSVTNTAGYITGSTKTGTAVTVSASELASGNKAITQNGTNIDVVGYSTVSVDVRQQFTATIENNGATSGNNYAYVQYNNTNYYTTGDTFTFSEGDTLTCLADALSGASKIYVNDEEVRSGYTISYAYSLPASDITIQFSAVSSGSSVKIYTVGGATLITKTITSNGTYNASSDSADGYSSVTVNVPSGSSKNVQVLQSTSRTNASSLTKVLGDLTVSKTGTYDVYWSGGRTNTSTSYTWGTRLYVDGTGYGTENTTWTNNCQSNHLSNVSLTANQKLSVYARGRTGSYYTFAPMLVIIEA